MAQFVARSKNVEVNGETVLSIVEGMGAAKAQALKLLTAAGISDPKPGHWYPQQAWLDAFRKISESLGPSTLQSIGKKIPENAKFPPAIDSLEKALGALDTAYHMNHRGLESGSFKAVKVGEKTIALTSDNPYPCEFDLGIVKALATRFAPKGSFLTVKHDDTKPCRKKDAQSCTYLVSW